MYSPWKRSGQRHRVDVWHQISHNARDHQGHMEELLLVAKIETNHMIKCFLLYQKVTTSANSIISVTYKEKLV